MRLPTVEIGDVFRKLDAKIPTVISVIAFCVISDSKFLLQCSMTRIDLI